MVSGRSSGTCQLFILATDADAPAPKACKDYSNNGKSDWYLPSLDELNALYGNRNYVGNMSLDFYWSSVQANFNGSEAWVQRFYNGAQREYGKATLYSVRAIRAF